MYRIPKDLDLSSIVGESTTQILVGQNDLQFSFGGQVFFAIESLVELVQNGEIIGSWDQWRWPDAKFFEIMNVKVVKYEIPNDRLIVIYFENGIEMHLHDDSDEFELMNIGVTGQGTGWII